MRIKSRKAQSAEYERVTPSVLWIVGGVQIYLFGVLSLAGKEEKVIRSRPHEDRSARAPRRQPPIRPGGSAG
jgi:hypothetical protein